jgi:hypothetical protein
MNVGWFAIRAGAAYYDLNSDVFRPAFLDLVFWNRWRTSFEFARTQRVLG